MAGEAIFIGYRRDDTADVAGRIYDAMAQRFGKARIFKDVDNIGPGVNFGDYIRGVLPKCRVALMLIGPNWLASKDEDGRRRLDDEHDWVRVEIETALATSGVLTVPVLVNGATMPRAADVPESLRPLLHRNAAMIRRDPDFHDDVERLASTLRASVSTGMLDLPTPAAAEPKRGSRIGRGVVVVGVAAALTVGIVLWGPWRTAPAPETTHATAIDTTGAQSRVQPTTTNPLQSQTAAATTATPLPQPSAQTTTMTSPASQTLADRTFPNAPDGASFCEALNGVAVQSQSDFSQWKIEPARRIPGTNANFWRSSHNLPGAGICHVQQPDGGPTAYGCYWYLTTPEAAVLEAQRLNERVRLCPGAVPGINGHPSLHGTSFWFSPADALPNVVSLISSG